MLFVLFYLDQDRYALEASRVVEVVPLLALTPLPQAPKGIAGLFNYRGQPVPALDLAELTLGRPARERLSTRIIIVSCPDERGNSRLLGLIVEHATEMLRSEPGQFQEPGLKLGRPAHLGPVLMDDRGAIQWLYPHRLLTEPVRELLFAASATTDYGGH